MEKTYNTVHTAYYCDCCSKQTTYRKCGVCAGDVCIDCIASIPHLMHVIVCSKCVEVGQPFADTIRRIRQVAMRDEAEVMRLWREAVNL